jgi:hypothetical protein
MSINGDFPVVRLADQFHELLGRLRSLAVLYIELDTT